LVKVDRDYSDHYRKYRHLITTKEINYITFRSDGTISFLPAGKEHKENDNGEWAREGRQNGRPGKVIRKLFAEKLARLIPDKEFEIFANQYKAEYNGEDYEFMLLDNKKIPSVYCMDRLNQGTLGNSCMNGDASYLGIYKCCPKLKILILKDKAGLLCARALVWYLEDDFILMDRIYTSKEFMYDMFLDYARKNKWHRKENYRSYDDKTDFVRPDGKCFSKTLTVHTATDFDKYPYIDTFSYGGDGYLTNDDGEPYQYDCTDGSRSGDPNSEPEDEHEGEVYDDINEEYISEDDSCYITAGERRYRDRHSHVDNCINIGDDWYYEDDSNIVAINGDWYRKDDDDICEINGDYHLTEDCTYCERDSCYYLCENCVYCEDDEEDVLRSEAVEINDKWYHKDSDLIVKIDGKWHRKDEVPEEETEEITNEQ